MKTETGYVDVNGVALRYRLRRTGLPRIALLHEMGGVLENWDDAADLLEKDFEILSYDSRGAGLSEKIHGEVDIDDLAGDLAALLDHIGWHDKIAIVGTAVGAAVAIRLAATQPRRVAAIVALAPALGVAEDRRAATVAAGDALIALGVRAATDPRWDRAWPPELRDDPARAEAVRCRKLGNDPESFAALYRMVARMDLTPDLPRLTCPCLFLAGAQDQTRPPQMVAAAAAAVANAEFDVFDSGHVLQAISPGPVAARIKSFLQPNR